MRVPAGRKNLLLFANNCKRMLVACRVTRCLGMSLSPAVPSLTLPEYYPIVFGVRLRPRRG